MTQNIIIINGPNLNLLGKREESQYGSVTFTKLEEICLDYAKKLGVNVSFKHSNIEGELVSMIQQSANHFQGLIINAAGYTHTSVSIHDALLTLKIPIIELHISNIYAREEFRQKSLISSAVNGIICGLGTDGYMLAIDAMLNLIKKK